MSRAYAIAVGAQNEGNLQISICTWQYTVKRGVENVLSLWKRLKKFR